MPQARSIHVGLNALHADSYRGWEGRLLGCENDARAMQVLADARGFTSLMLLHSGATLANVCSALERAASKLTAGDLLLLTYSGHGGSVSDRSGDEPDGCDELWCLYDRPLLDDELHARLCAFAAGVRVLVVSDSCYSGSVTRDDRRGASATSVPRRSPRRDGSALGRERRAPSDHLRAIVRANREEYAERKAAVAPTRTQEPAASVLLLAACEDHQTVRDGDPHGMFTAALLETWKRGDFNGDYDALREAIRTKVDPTQTPTLFSTGAPDPEFRAKRPFTP
ncbi:MAG: caspase family protein [Kofleriaceae bacterium]